LAEFEGQAEKAINRYLRAEYRKAAEGVRNGAKAGEIDPDIVEQLGLDLGPGVKRIMRRIYPKVLQKAFGDAELALDVDIAWNVENKEVQAVLGELADLVTRVTETTKNSIRSLVGRAAGEGWSIERLAKEILESGAVVSKSRARMIARTETASAYSMGSLLAYTQSKVVEGVEWLTTIDDLTCPDCKGLNGEIRDLEDKVFSTGIAHPPAHPHCRCAIAPIVKKV
jgi:SPP1 gp7 family putative phage head morphogenesis protein